MRKRIGLADFLTISWVLLAPFVLQGWPGPVWAGQPDAKQSVAKERSVTKEQAEDYVPGEVLVLLSADVNRDGVIDAGETLEGVEKAIHGVIQQRISLSRGRQVLRVKLPPGKTVIAAQAEKWGKQDSRIIAVEPNYRVHALNTPNDPLYPEMWGLNNVGQTGGIDDADIDAPEAWDITTGSPEVIVAVIDSGVDYLHPDLAGNMWINAFEIPDNGIDDDGNGYIDDVHGYDFVQHDSDPSDAYGHGTHVAGTIAASGNNGLGVTGVNWQARLMACRFLNAFGYGSTLNAIEAINYAVANGARILNNSWGGGGYSETLKAAIENARDNGVLFIAAAGNSASDNDFSPHYPASYDVSNVISAAATDHTDGLAGFSNYGYKTVDMAAPGQSVLSTVPYYETLFFEDFQSASLPGFEGTQMTLEGPVNRWGTIQSAGGPNNIAARGDWENAQPYLGGSDGSIVTPAMDTRGLRGLLVEFLYRYEIGSTDALTMDVWDGGAWRTLFSLSGSCCFYEEGYYITRVEVPEHFRNAEMKIRFRWVSDAADNDYYGGEIDNIRVSYISDGSENYALYSGTSMAAPHVSGAAALILAQHPNYTFLDVKTLMMNTIDPLSSLSGRVLTGGRLNVNNALSCVPGNANLIVLSPGDSFTAYKGYDNRVSLMLADCTSSFTGAIVDVTPTNGDSPFSLLDDGIAPDVTADDGIYTGTWNPVNPGPTTLNMSASGVFGTLEGSVSGDVVELPIYLVDDQIPFNWIDATSGTNLGIVYSDTYVEIPIGFDFEFYGEPHSTVKVSSNGYLTFGSDGYDYSNDPIPASTEPNDLIAPFWDDLNPGFAGAVYALLEGVAPDRRLTIEWHDVAHYYDVGMGTFQVTLYEGSNDIIFRYLDMDYGDSAYNYGASATVGIEEASGAVGLQYAYNQPVIFDQMAIRFYLKEDCPSCTIEAGLVAGTAEGRDGDTISVPIEVRNGPSDVYSLGFEVHFDATKLAVTGCDFTGTFLENWTFKDCNSPQPGVVIVGGFTTDTGIPLGDSGPVVYLNFDVVACEEGQQCSLELMNFVDDIATWESCAGCFTCVPCDGDVNGDGQVTPADARNVFACFLGQQACTPTELVRGDVNRNGQLTPEDAQCIFNKFLQRPPEEQCDCFLAQ